MSKKILTAVLSTQFKMTPGEIATALEGYKGPETDENDDAVISLITTKDTERVKAFNEAAKARFDDGHKKGKSETMAAFEKQIRTEYGVDDESLQGVELIKHIATDVETKAAAAGGKKGQITDDDIIKSAKYIELSKQFKAREAELLKEKETAVNEVLGKQQEKDLHALVSGQADTILTEMGIVLPTDPARAKWQKDNFIKSAILSNKLELANDGKTIIIKDADGNQMKDAHGHALEFTDFVKNTAGAAFDVVKTDKRDGPGNGKPGEQKPGDKKPAGVLTIAVPKNLEELAKMTDDPNIDNEQKQLAFDAYEQQNTR